MIDKICGIYCIENIVNGKKYIGCAVDIRRRIIRHFSELKNNCHDNLYLQRSYDKYGVDNFKYFIVQELERDEDLLECMEIYWIAYYNSFVSDGGGYNLSRGGYGPLGKIMSEESKKKLSESKKGKHPTEETRQKLRDWVRTPEMVEQIKKTKKENPKPAWNKGIPMTEEMKKHMSQVMRKNPIKEKSPISLTIRMQGIKRQINTSSKYVGVYYCKKRSNWVSTIFFESEKIHIGTFLYETEAALAYNEFALELYGYNATLNIIPQEEIDNLWNLE